jgi:exopolysaccharide production protein ExoZ
MAEKSTSKVESIQYLRALAAVGVVLAHSSTTLAGIEDARLHFSVGIYGVDLFFVISGFVMFYTTAGQPKLPGPFFLKRCIRVVPIYFFLTTLATISLHFWATQSSPHSVSPWDYLRSILFIPYLNPATREIQPVIRQGWTLNYEMFFYLVFACSLWLKEKYRVQACAGVFATLAVIGFCVAPTGACAITYTDPIMLEFVLGVLIGYFFVRCTAEFSRLILVLLVATAVSLVCVLGFGVWHRVLFAGVPWAAVVSIVIWLERRGHIPHWPLFLLLGDASYSLYLLHTFVLSLMKHPFLRIFDVSRPSSHLIFMILSLVVSLPVAVLFYKIVELPITKYLQALTKRQAQN